MMVTPLARRLAIVTAIVAFVALFIRYSLTISIKIDEGGTVLDGLWELARFYTVWMNTAVFILVLGVAIAPASRFGRARAWLLILPSIIVVGVVFYALLADRAHPRGSAAWLAEHLLHAAVPILSVITFLAMTHGLMRWGQLGWGIILGATYGIYLIARGALEGDYPYWFVNIPQLGIWGSIQSAVMLMGTFALVTALVIGTDKLLGLSKSSYQEAT